MDEIEYKLKSQDPTLISHAISKLVQMIMKKSENESDITKIPEFKTLTLKCNSDDSVVSISACQALIMLTEAGLYTFKSAIATFISVCSLKNCELITVAVSQLLMLDYERNESNGYILQAPNQHPFIMILNQEKLSWRTILNQMKRIIHDGDKDLVKQRLELLRPVFLYILCNPSIELEAGFKQQTWQLVLEFNDVSDLKVEILLWLCTNQSHSCIDTNCRVLEFAEKSLLKKDIKCCTALLPLIMSMTIKLLEYGHHPGQNFCMIADLIEKCCYNYVGDIAVTLIAEIILICPAAYLSSAFHICRDIVDRMSCDVILLHTLAASLLKWLAYPSVLCQDSLPIAKELVNKIAQEKVRDSYNDEDIEPNELLLAYGQGNSHIRFYTELIRDVRFLDDDAENWLENLSRAPVDLRYSCKLVLCGIFLYSDEPRIVQKTCQILVQLVKNINSFSSHMLSLLLYKLTKSRDSSTVKCLLLALPEFVVFKENLRIVTHTLDSLLNNDKSLRYFAIQLYAKALDKEPRCHRFLSDALIDLIKENEHDSWQSDVACAQAIKHVCKSRPELCTEFVPLLSQILNRCVDLNGGAASALALDSISALCKSIVIGFSSTWKLLAPKMRKEQRTMVLESLCEFLSDVPSFRFKQTEEYDSFFLEIVSLLWNYVVRTDTRVAEAALKALKSYSFLRVPQNALPPNFRSNLTVPQKCHKKGTNNDVNPEDVLQYVPGICWIQMLKGVNKGVLSAAGDLLISYIEEELGTYRSHIYIWPQGEPRDFKYLPERSVIRAIGEHLRRSDDSDPTNQRIIVECMRVFAHEYTKLLPNVRWEFLNKHMQISEASKEYGLAIVSRHSSISLSAKQLVEGCLSQYNSINFKDAGHLLLNEKHLVFYSNLCEICRAVGPTDLKQYLEVSLDYVVDRISLNDEKAVAWFDRIMSAYTAVLKSDEIHLGNHTLLFTMLENVFRNVDLTSRHYGSYFTAIMELSIEKVERMTSPSVWWEDTPEKIRNAIAVRIELGFRRFTDTPLAWLNELINVIVSNSTPGMQMYLLESLQKVLGELRLEKHCVAWLLDFMNRIDALMLEPSNEKDTIVFHCDILFISVICLSGMDCLPQKKESLSISQDSRTRLFPQAICTLVDKQMWKSITRQIMNWLNHMRTSSLPDAYRSALQSALILLRHEKDYTLQWTNYLSVKTCIQI